MTRRTKEIRNVRKKARRKKKHMVRYRGSNCEQCEGSFEIEKLTIHHILSISEGGNNHMDNLMLVCDTCHKRIHRGKVECKITK